jgi:hypothetical protein
MIHRLNSIKYNCFYEKNLPQGKQTEEAGSTKRESLRTIYGNLKLLQGKLCSTSIYDNANSMSNNFKKSR